MRNTSTSTFTTEPSEKFNKNLAHSSSMSANERRTLFLNIFYVKAPLAKNIIKPYCDIDPFFIRILFFCKFQPDILVKRILIKEKAI